MWAHRVVVLDALAQDAFAVALAEDQQPVWAFAPEGPDPALGVGPGARCSERRTDDACTLGAEHVVEGSGNFASRSRISTDARVSASSSRQQR